MGTRFVRNPRHDNWEWVSGVIETNAPGLQHVFAAYLRIVYVPGGVQVVQAQLYGADSAAIDAFDGEFVLATLLATWQRASDIPETAIRGSWEDLNAGTYGTYVGPSGEYVGESSSGSYERFDFYPNGTYRHTSIMMTTGLAISGAVVHVKRGPYAFDGSTVVFGDGPCQESAYNSMNQLLSRSSCTAANVLALHVSRRGDDGFTLFGVGHKVNYEWSALDVDLRPVK
jgi:hypothetical protein